MIITKQEKDDHGYMTIVHCVLILSLVSYITEMKATDLAAKMIAIRMELTTDAFANTFFLFYILRFCNYRVNKGFKLSVVFLHIIGIASMYLNDWHGLYYTSAVLIPQDGFVTIQLGRGPLYCLYMLFNFMHMLVFEWACISRFCVSRGRIRKVYSRLILVGLAPYFCYLLFSLGLTENVDVTGVGFLVVGILITNTAIHYGFDNTISIAKDKLINQMHEGLLVTDENDDFVYGNPTALDIFPELVNRAYSREKVKLEQFLQIRGNRIYRKQHVYECSIIPMIEKEKKVGSMYLLHEITEIDRLASRDSMTGLYNHKMFYKILEDCIRKCEQQDWKVAIAFIDIDDFKAVNDKYGHDNGDVVIIQLATLLKKYGGEHIHACRYGGEEFAVIFECEKAEEAKQIMEKVQKEFHEYEFPFSREELTFSCAIRHYEYGLGMEEYFAKTDKLLYYIKRNGKKQILEAAS